MTTLREAAQQALEALEFLADEWGFTHKANRPERWRAIEALRAALAQQEQEPAAWMMINREHATLARSLHWTPQTDWHITWEAVPLYAHPPRREWQGLTEEEIEDLRDDRYFRFARAVEAALKEKNQ